MQYLMVGLALALFYLLLALSEHRPSTWPTGSRPGRWWR